MRAAALLLLFATTSAWAQDAAPPPPPVLPAATVVARWEAEEARQGVAIDARHFYAISNNRIGKYDRRTGKRIAQWEGEKRLFPHMNSCIVEGRQLVCAASNYPKLPMASAVEFFDLAPLRHVRSVALPPMPGSLTWIERRGRDWYAGFANYPEGRGGEAGRDHRWTLLVRMDGEFRPTGSWHFPESLLDRFAPMSNSGGSWGPDGLLYVTGHDRAELYALKLPEAGTVLEHVATIPIVTNGQAFVWDRGPRRTIWSIDRATKSVVASSVPAIPH